jgi:hypothetical protein
LIHIKRINPCLKNKKQNKVFQKTDNPCLKNKKQNEVFQKTEILKNAKIAYFWSKS